MTMKFILCLFSYFYIHIGRLGTQANVVLKLSNDGPAVLDSTITFYAIMMGDIPDDDYQYVFEDNTEAKVNSRTVTGNRSANVSLVVDSTNYTENYYTMKVSVYKMIFHIIPELVVSGKMSFHLTEGINGDILVGGQKPDMIPVGPKLNYTFLLHDPSHFFSGAEFVYIWKFNQTAFFNKNNSIVFGAAQPGKLLVSLSVFARKTSANSTKSATIDSTYRALYPVNNVTVHGNVFLKRGELLSLDISCNGSSPYRYCAKVFEDNGTDICDGQDPVVSTQCSFSIIHYFKYSGKYKVGFMIRNDFNIMNRTVDIQIYDVDKRPQLSTIIFPIASCCIGFVIVVIGAAYHLQQRRTYVVEVADFDFQEPVMLIEKTFVARVKDSIRDALDNYHSGRSPPTRSSKLIVNGSSRTTPISSHYSPLA